VTERKRADHPPDRSNGAPLASTKTPEDLPRSNLTPAEYMVLDDRLVRLLRLLQKMRQRLDTTSDDYWTLRKISAMLDRMRYDLEQNQTQHTPPTDP
jgi:hypothetical protein